MIRRNVSIRVVNSVQNDHRSRWGTQLRPISSFLVTNHANVVSLVGGRVIGVDQPGLVRIPYRHLSHNGRMSHNTKHLLANGGTVILVLATGGLLGANPHLWGRLLAVNGRRSTIELNTLGNGHNRVHFPYPHY